MKPKQGYAKPDNYAAFYGLLKQMPGASKEEIVLQFTNGRTDSLREMSLHEYNEAIRAMEKLTRAEETEAMRILKSKRSAVLHGCNCQVSIPPAGRGSMPSASTNGSPANGLPGSITRNSEALLKKIRAIRRKQKEGD